MLYNIFRKKNKEEEGEKKQKQVKPKIIADIHEKNSLVFAELLSLEAELEIKSLEIGDYLIGETVIERKTVSDFISSMFSKRLLEQLKNMHQYNSRLLILEGNISENIKNQELKINPNALKGMILSISLDFNTPIIFTENEKETSIYLFLLAKRQLKPNQEISLHSKIPMTKEENKKYILEAFPGIGPKTSKKLLKEFKTLENIFNSSEDSLKQILKSKTEEFKQLLKE